MQPSLIDSLASHPFPRAPRTVYSSGSSPGGCWPRVSLVAHFKLMNFYGSPYRLSFCASARAFEICLPTLCIGGLSARWTSLGGGTHPCALSPPVLEWTGILSWDCYHGQSTPFWSCLRCDRILRIVAHVTVIYSRFWMRAQGFYCY